METSYDPKPATPKESSSLDASFLLLGSPPPSLGRVPLHPQPVQIFKLWQTFLDNVNPLSKVIHAPTLQVKILDATGNLDNLQPNMEALLFAIYTTAICSLSSDECEIIMGEPKTKLFPRFLTATEQALSKASFLESSDLMLLQAFVLLLIAMRQTYSPHSLWVLTGVAIRIGQRMGLHSDGKTLGLSVFEAEMRRRVWWQIVLLDNRNAQLSGLKNSVVANFFDTNIPANINDTDLNPNMSEQLLEHKYQTEMIFCLITYEIGRFVKEGGYQKIFGAPSSVIKDQIINDLETRLEENYLKYCDRLIPLHFLCLAVARSITMNIRLMAHHPRHWKASGATMPPEERDMLFNLSLQMIENDTKLHTMTSLKPYLWHVNIHFQLDAFIYILSEIRRQPPGGLFDRAWDGVQQVYNMHKELITEDYALYIAIGKLAIRAWEAREAHLSRMYQGNIDPPRFIAALQQKIPANKDPKPKPDGRILNHQAFENFHPTGSELHDGTLGIGFDDSTQFNPLYTEISPLSWEEWSELFQEYEQQITNSNGPRIFG